MATAKDKSQAAVKKAVAAHEKSEKEKATVTRKARSTKKKTTKKKVTKKAAAKPSKMGRPTKYKKEFCDTVIDNMAEGLSFEACCGVIGISKDTGYRWIKEHDDFSDAKKRGDVLSQLWWENQGKKGMFWGKDFNATVWVFAMKNRHDWSDRKDLNLGGQPGNPIQAQGPLGAILDELDGFEDDELDIEIEKILARREANK